MITGKFFFIHKNTDSKGEESIDPVQTKQEHFFETWGNLSKKKNNGELEKILVVDDDPGIRRVLTRILEHEGHEVVTAEDGPSALQIIRDQGPSVVLMDYMMPGMDGERVLETIRKEHQRKPKTVLITADTDQLARLDEIGAEEGLSKPFRTSEILDAVKRLKSKIRSESN